MPRETEQPKSKRENSFKKGRMRGLKKREGGVGGGFKQHTTGQRELNLKQVLLGAPPLLLATRKAVLGGEMARGACEAHPGIRTTREQGRKRLLEQSAILSPQQQWSPEHEGPKAAPQQLTRGSIPLLRAHPGVIAIQEGDKL